MIDQFVFDMKTRVLFGAGSLKKLHEEQLPGKKALVVISNGGKKTPQNPALPLSDADVLGMLQRSYK